MGFRLGNARVFRHAVKPAPPPPSPVPQLKIKIQPKRSSDALDANIPKPAQSPNTSKPLVTKTLKAMTTSRLRPLCFMEARDLDMAQESQSKLVGLRGPFRVYLDPEESIIPLLRTYIGRS